MSKIKFQDSYGLTEWGLALVLAIFAISLFAVIVGGTVLSEIGYCNTQQALMPNVDFQWVFWGGCLLKSPDGMWVDASDYLGVDRLRLQMEGDIK